MATRNGKTLVQEGCFLMITTDKINDGPAIPVEIVANENPASPPGLIVAAQGTGFRFEVSNVQFGQTATQLIEGTSGGHKVRGLVVAEVMGDLPASPSTPAARAYRVSYQLWQN